MATKTTKRRAGNTVLQQARHYTRYLRHDHGESAADIAKTEGVSQAAVEKSINLVRFHRGMNSQQNLNTAVVGMLMSNVGRAHSTMSRMLDAKNYIEHKLADGSTRLVPVDNPKVQLEALEIFGKYVESMQPKQSGMNLKIQQNNANHAQVVSNAKSGGFEEVLHGVIGKVRAANQLPFATADVIESEEDDDEGDDE